MGILNVTPDSFSDGGRYASVPMPPSSARLSWRPRVRPFSTSAGNRPGPEHSASMKPRRSHRVVPVIERIARNLDVAISIDTSKPGVMAAATGAGACIVNDVYALRAPGAREWAAAGWSRGVLDAHAG